MNRTTIAKYTKFSVEELQQSVSDPLSCVVAVQLNEILSLRPSDCEHIVKGVRRCVTDKIGQYHPKLSGIVLGYAKIRVDNALSAFRLDSPYLHVRATIDYFVFQPQIDRKLRGTVNYVSNRFVCVVLYRVFNVTVRLTKGIKNVTKESEIAFVVRSCNMQCDIPVIEGELVSVTGGVEPPARIKQEPGTENGAQDVIKEETDGTDAPAEHGDGQEDRLSSTATDGNTETGDNSAPAVVVVKQEPKTPKQTPKKRKQKESAPNTPTVANGLPTVASSPDSDSDAQEAQRERINALLGKVFGKEVAESVGSSGKKRKNKQKKSPEKSSPVVEAIRIKQELLSDVEDAPSQQNGKEFVPNGFSTPAPANGVNGTGKKRKIRFDLTPTVSYIKTEPTESRQKKKKSE